MNVPVEVPVEEVLVGSKEERTGSTGRVEDAKLCHIPRSLLLQEFPNGVLDDVVHDVLGCVVDSPGFLYLGLVFHLGLVPWGEPDHLP